MSDKRSHEQLDSLRERLYARGEMPLPRERAPLESEVKEVKKTWDIPEKVAQPDASSREESVPAAPDIGKPPRRRYRAIFLMIGVAFFALSLAVSSVYLLLGRNTVSGDNITLSLNGPFTLSGGDVMSLQVGITNTNGTPIESATLVIEYPPGTRSAEGEGQELLNDRLALGRIGAGETMNKTFHIRVFGEENQESTIKASIEYRVAGSNATFNKEAPPFNFKIGSAPVVIQVEGDKTISSGEETTLTLSITSNSPSPINDLLVKAEYPSGFDFTKSEPAPISGRNVWRIDTLKPEETVKIKISGAVVGIESEKRVLKFTAGAASSRDSSSIASVMAVASAEIDVEAPFLATTVTIDNSREETVSVAPGVQASSMVELKNVLGDPVYDVAVEVVLSGNALLDTDVQAIGGHYDSNSRTIRWDRSSDQSLERIEPGKTTRLSFTLRPQTAGVQTPQVSFSVRVSGRRVSENNAREEISGTIKRTIRVESKPTLEANVSRSSSDSGPIPPVVGQNSTYTVVWRAKSTANSLSGAVVSASLPSYVTWTGVTGGAGTWSYNPTSRVVEWRAGEVGPGRDVSGTFQISLLPSASQIDRTPTIVGDSSLRANDNFTGSVLRATAGELTTEISGDRGSGTVQAN